MDFINLINIMCFMRKWYTWIIIIVLIFSTRSVGFAHASKTDSTTTKESLGPNINTTYDEQHPLISVQGNVLYFTRKNHPDNSGGIADAGDIWISNLGENGLWQPARRLEGPVNNPDYNAVIGFSNDGEKMFLLNHYRKKGRAARTQGISMSKLVNGNWSFPQNIPIAYYYNKSDDASMRLSNDGKIIMMSIESYDSKGAEDLYVSFLNKDDSWSQPVNLGRTINTEFQEMTPYLADDNMTLFFASNGHGGFGSRDIFITRRLDNTWKNWTKPTNMGNIINSKGVELSYYIQDNDYAYFVSTQNSEGFGDIQRIKIQPDLEKPDNLVDLELSDNLDTANSENEVIPGLPEAVVEKADEWVSLHGKVVNANNLKYPVWALLSYTQIDSLDNVKETYSNDSSGYYQIDLEEGYTYLLTVSAEGYMSTTERISVTQTNAPSLQKHYLLTPLEIGAIVKLKNVLFERGTANLLEGSYTELNNVVEMMHDNPQIIIELGGHTDNKGSGKLNLELSQHRVNMVISYLEKQGIEAGRMTGKGYGGTRPIASNANEDSRKLNRRVEFTIVKN